MFWTKCGKLVKRGENPVDANECPCGYWGVFVISYYNKSHAEDEPGSLTVSDCCYKNVTAFVYNVTYNSIDISSFIDAPERMCVSVSREADASGRVGGLDTDIFSPYSCAEYDDETGECVRRSKIHYIVDIYRIGGWYDDYREFADFFYSGCGVKPDAEGNYPYIPDHGSGCISDYWQPLAEKLYRPSCRIVYDIYHWSYNVFYPEIECVWDYQTHSRCEGECREYDGAGNCIDCAGEIVTDTERRCNHAIHNSIRVMDMNTREEEWYTIGGYAYLENDKWKFKDANCCEYWDGLPSALAQVKAFSRRKSNASNYQIDETKSVNIPGGGNPMCWGDSDCFAYHGEWGNWQYWQGFRYAWLRFERREDTPENATGVRIIINAYTYKTTEEYAVVKDKVDGIYDNLEMTLEFGQTEKFPICDNMADYCVEEEPACYDDCERGNFPPSLRPGGWENKTEIFYINLAVIGYTY